ncbi:MAG: hypothetical protein JO000_28810 [Alphaproteobacteria bacterium]|nr:hypothetical protein [Alphaproteobacteria bacterium]
MAQPRTSVRARVTAGLAGTRSSRRSRSRSSAHPLLSPGARRCRRKFLDYFPKGFADASYCELERDYKWSAHQRWERTLDKETFRARLQAREFETIAGSAIGIEARTNLLFSFEKMALRDAVKTRAGARAFAVGLFELLHGEGDIGARFDAWCAVVGGLPRRQTRVLTWPALTVFPFLAQPKLHFFLKPNVTRRAFALYGLPFAYVTRPNGDAYEALLALARKVKRDLAPLRPRDMIDVQSFLWVQGSDEYPD